MPSASPRLIVVLDFDGTVTQKDIGDEVCDRFAPPRWREIDAAWVRSELSLPDAQRRMWQLCRCEREEAIAYAKRVGVLRPGLGTLVEMVSAAGGELWLASGGFDFYIEGLLGPELSRFERVYYNRTRFIGGQVEVEFPHTALACGLCAVCKGTVCDLARAVAPRVVFIGDGASDRCAIDRSDALFAVRNSLLAKTCESRGAAFTPFDDFGEVVESLRRG